MTSGRFSPELGGRQRSVALLVVSAAAIVRLVFAARLPLFPDEAYYWAWSTHPAAGYFDHPAGIALLIRFGTSSFEALGLQSTELAVRFGPVIAGWIAALATMAIAWRVAQPSRDRDAAMLRAAVVITVMPLAAAGLILATPDSPLLATTALTLYCVVRALEAPLRSRGSLMWWLSSGVMLGLAFSSKYTSIFVPLAVVLGIVLHAESRSRLREPGPYLACVIATLVFLPALVWNAHHGWISFAFQIRHGLSAPSGSMLVAAWKHEGDLLGGQVGLVSPILFVMMAIAVAHSLRRRATPAAFALAMVALVTFAFFVYSAIRQRVEPNWPAPAYIPAIALLAALPWRESGKRWLGAGVALAALISLVIYVQALVPILPLRADRDPIARAFGWRDLAATADSTARTATAETHSATWLGGDRYQEASELAFYDPSHPPTFATNLAGRPNQYDLWPGFSNRARVGDNLAMVVDESTEPERAVKELVPYFTRVARGPAITLQRPRPGGVPGPPIAKRRLWLLLGWRGGWPASN